MKRFTIILLALAGFVIPLTAHNTDRIYVKNGSIYEGYISTQEPGSSITVAAQSAILIVKAEDILKLETSSKAVAELPESMREWLKKNHPSQNTAEVASFKMGGLQYNNVLVLEKGSRYKVISFDKRVYSLGWSDVVKSCKNEALYKERFGIYDIVTLKNGKRFKGTIVEQIIGVEVKIKYNGNSMETIRFTDILSIRSELINPNANLWQQLPLLDKIELVDGTTLTGFISSRIMGQNILFIPQNSSVEKKISLKEITRYNKIANSQYVCPQKESASSKPAIITTNTKTENTDKGSNARPSKWDDNATGESTTKQNTSSVTEQPTAAKMGITINGKMASLNLVQTYDDVHYLIYDIVDIVPHGRNIRINLPISLRDSKIKIIKLRSYSIPGPEDKKLPGWTDKDANQIGITATSIDSEDGVDGRWNIEIKSGDIEPGIYALLPLINTSRCLAFRVKP